MATFKILILFVLLDMSAKASIPPSWYTGHQNGWLWYQKEKKHSLFQPNKPGDIKGNTQKNDRYTKQLAHFRKTFEEIQAKAILEPTLTNVQRLQQAQNTIMEDATHFSKIWMLASLLTSQNFRASDHPNPHHRKIFQEQRDRQLDLKIKGLAKTHGLFFAFKEDCSYCQKFAPIVQQLLVLYGFECKAISADGKVSSFFPHAEMDNGTLSVINPEGIFPSLFLVNPHTRQVIPLARGLLNLTQLRENFKVIIEFLEGTYRER